MLATSEAMKHYVNPILAALTSGGDVGQYGTNLGIQSSQLEYNYMTHAEREEFEQLLAECSGGRDQSCARVEELQELSGERGELLESCVGVYSAECVSSRRDLTLAAADYYEAATLGQSDLDGLSLLDRHMVFVNLARLSDPNDLTYREGLDDLAELYQSDASRTLLTGTPEQIDQVLRGPVAVGTIVFGPAIGGTPARGIVGIGGVRPVVPERLGSR
ncbi:hypothetical protein Q0601_07575 [Paracoccus onubensis]|uniref:DUF6862 domain-containing protein n=1 Tax=Paracoccus onubensis TaxID=1675788 RepID=UPI00273171FE|nr:hypothetical protein [Paracoccus onubensis]MDP0927025.1 hypothetical protein [Paracoccus onubensis]